MTGGVQKACLGCGRDIPARSPTRRPAPPRCPDCTRVHRAGREHRRPPRPRRTHAQRRQSLELRQGAPPSMGRRARPVVSRTQRRLRPPGRLVRRPDRASPDPVRRRTRSRPDHGRLPLLQRLGGRRPVTAGLRVRAGRLSFLRSGSPRRLEPRFSAGLQGRRGRLSAGRTPGSRRSGHARRSSKRAAGSQEGPAVATASRQVRPPAAAPHRRRSVATPSGPANPSGP